MVCDTQEHTFPTTMLSPDGGGGDTELLEKYQNPPIRVGRPMDEEHK